jgi:hypothetical protein
MDEREPHEYIHPPPPPLGFSPRSAQGPTNKIKGELELREANARHEHEVAASDTRRPWWRRLLGR